MRLLLDTHALLWWLADDPRLGGGARELLASRDHEVFVSAASVWEIVIKTALGKLELGMSVDELVAGLPGDGFEQLPIESRHVVDLTRLPPIHRDPFDRIMVAQARTEGLVFVTADAKIEEYEVEVLRAAER